MKDVLVIVNPASRGGRTARDWYGLQDSLRDAGLDFEAALTTRPYEAIEIARAAVRASRPLVVAAGGDGTINEVANGFFESGRVIETKTALGLLPLGTGGDFRRTFAIPDDPKDAVLILKSGRRRQIDAGRVTFRTPAGHTAERYFVNIADAGIAGDVVERVNASSKTLGGAGTFMLASAASVLRYRNKWMRVTVDGQRRELVAQQVVVANGQYYGAGMKVAPLALPDDGFFDVLIVGDLSLFDNVRGLGSVRSGKHLDRQRGKYEHFRARRVEVESPERVLVDIDGEQPGTVPATFDMLPRALTLVTP